MESIVLGGGCFWCLEAAYQLVEGVEHATSGYAGGSESDPTYEQVCDGKTHHAEVVQLVFNPSIITLGELLDIFWTIHDPTTLNRQGSDVGSQYRSIILYTSPNQRAVIEASVNAAQKLWSDSIVTEVKPLIVFYDAEPYHQNYFANHPEQAYCQAIINPKLQKLRARYAAKLKS